MIRSLLNLDFEGILCQAIAVILAMSIHEMAHALVSYWLGDPTAKRMGRLSLNPFHHIDWMGLLCLFLFGFGWARPVPIDSRYYKDEKAGIVWTSFAGPVANFLLSFVMILIYYGLAYLATGFALGNWFGQFLMNVCSYTAIISAGFGIFNLIPIPPLDGAKIFWAFLPDETYYKWMRPQPWMQMIFILLVCFGVFTTPLSAMRNTLIGWMSSAASAFWGLFL